MALPMSCPSPLTATNCFARPGTNPSKRLIPSPENTRSAPGPRTNRSVMWSDWSSSATVSRQARCSLRQFVNSATTGKVCGRTWDSRSSRSGLPARAIAASSRSSSPPSPATLLFIPADSSLEKMRFSLWPTTSQSWDDLLEVAQFAAEAGFEGLWVADHFMPPTAPADGPLLECWSTLAGLATTVPRLRLGSLVTGNTYRHPAVLANMAATVDHLSGGRVVLGLGAGWQENEHLAYGIDFSDVPGRLARLAEACAVIRSLLDEPRASFEGRYYKLRDAPMAPKPVQSRLPLLVGGSGEKVTLRIAARWADEWNTWGTPEVIAAKCAVLDRHCAALGRDPGEIHRSAQVVVNLEGTGAPFSRLPHVEVTVGELQDLLGAYAAAGVGEFILPDWNLGTGAKRREVLERFLVEVAAPFRA